MGVEAEEVEEGEVVVAALVDTRTNRLHMNGMAFDNSECSRNEQFC